MVYPDGQCRRKSCSLSRIFRTDTSPPFSISLSSSDTVWWLWVAPCWNSSTHFSCSIWSTPLFRSYSTFSSLNSVSASTDQKVSEICRIYSLGLSWSSSSWNRLSLLRHCSWLWNFATPNTSSSHLYSWLGMDYHHAAFRTTSHPNTKCPLCWCEMICWLSPDSCTRMFHILWFCRSRSPDNTTTRSHTLYNWNLHPVLCSLVWYLCALSASHASTELPMRTDRRIREPVTLTALSSCQYRRRDIRWLHIPATNSADFISSHVRSIWWYVDVWDLCAVSSLFSGSGNLVSISCPLTAIWVHTWCCWQDLLLALHWRKRPDLVSCQSQLESIDRSVISLLIVIKITW